MAFRLESCDASLLETASHELVFERELRAPPDVVHETFVACLGDPPWMPGFVGIDWHSEPGKLDGAVVDELFTFMAMRVRVVEHTPGRRTVACIDRWSLPLARRMVELVVTDPLPGSGTRLHFRVAFDPPTIARPFAPPVQAVFRRWFQASIDGLGRMLDGATASPARA